jgi:Family of unknown function (DUF5677)
VAELQLYRHIVDVLLAEHENSAPPSPAEDGSVRLLACTWGIYCQVHRFARAAVVLTDKGFGQEGTILVRALLQHTVVLHWITQRGSQGVEAMPASQSRQMKTWLRNTRDTTLAVPQALADEITDSFAGIDESAAIKMFRDICRQVDCEDLYAVYGIQSQTVHPTIATSNTYVDTSGNLRITPAADHQANMSLIAHCLIWAGRAMDSQLAGTSRADELERLARCVEARPVLPAYHPIPATRSGGRRTRRRGRRQR